MTTLLHVYGIDSLTGMLDKRNVVIGKIICNESDLGREEIQNKLYNA